MAKRRKRKMSKSQIKRAHRGARKIIRSGRKGVNPWAVAMAAVKKKAAKRSRKRKGNRRRRH